MLNSILIASKNKEKAEEEILKICKKYQIAQIDISTVESEKTIGIGQIRELAKKLFLKPIKSKQKAVILNAYNGLTKEAQNALLKMLEEPPDNTLIFLTVNSREEVLPTITSRCKIFNLNNEAVKVDEVEKKKISQLLESLPKKGVGERLKIAQDIAKDKKEAVLWLEKMILVLREKLIESKKNGKKLEFDALLILKAFQKAHKTASTTNANLRLLVENLFLSF